MRRLLLALVLLSGYLTPAWPQDDPRGHYMGPPDDCTHGQTTTWDATLQEWVCANLSGGGGGGGLATCGAPALILSTASAAGSSSQAVCTDSTLAIFDLGLPVAPASAAASGGVAFSARRDHVHPFPVSLMAANTDLLTLTSDGSIVTAAPTATRGLLFSSDAGITFSATGTVTIDGSELIAFAGTVGGWTSHVFPDDAADGTLDLGIAGQRWRTVRASESLELTDHSANFPATVTFLSSPPLDAPRELTIDLSNADHTLSFPITVDRLTTVTTTPGDTLVFTSNGTNQTLTSSRIGANLLYVDGSANEIFAIYDSNTSDRGIRVKGHAMVGRGTALIGDTSQNNILAVSEKASDSPFATGIQVTPDLDTNVGSGGAGTGGVVTGQYGLRVTAPFDSCDIADCTDPGATGEPFTLTGHRIQWNASLAGTALKGWASEVHGFDVTFSTGWPAGSPDWGAIHSYRARNPSFTNITASHYYGIKIDGVGTVAPAATRWAGMFVGDVQVTGTNKLIFGGTALGKTTDTMYRIAANRLRWQINGGDELELSATSLFPVVNAGLTLGQNDNGWGSLFLKDTAAAFELTLQASNIGADRTLTLDPSGNFTLTIDGNATLNDWFDQSVKTTADPIFNTLKLNDSDDSHQVTVAMTSNVTAARQVSVVTGDADRTLTLPIGSTGANTNGSVWWGDNSASFDTGDEVCAAQGLTCVDSYDVGSATPVACNSATHAVKFIVFCK